MFSLWDPSKEEVNTFIKEANNYHATIKFTAEISDKGIAFLDTRVYKGARFEKESILNTRTRSKPTETGQYTRFKSCHPLGVKKGFVKGEALRLLRTNSSKETFEENINKFKQNLRLRGYPNNFVVKVLSEVKFSNKKSALKEKTKARKEILPFVAQYDPRVPNLKQILVDKWHLIEPQFLLRQIYKELPLIS